MTAELTRARGRAQLIRGADGPLMVYRSGMGAPLLLLVHGITGSALYWHTILPALARRYQVIAIDARGHGRSAELAAPGSRISYAAHRHAADLVAVLDGLGIARAALMGHSMGAENVACCAASYPERVVCTVLEDPPWFPLPFAPRRDLVEEWRGQIEGEQRQPDAELRARLAEAHPTAGVAVLEELMADRRRLSPAVTEWLVERDHWSRFLPDLAAPTLLLTADVERGAIVTPNVAGQVQARAAMAGSGRIQLRHVAGAGHGIHGQQPGAFLAAVLPFLAAHADR